MDRLHISLKKSPALRVTRISIGSMKLVYIICANKKVQYEKGKTPVVYIGTTKTGISRVAQSAADRSEDILSQRGINSFDVRIVTCGGRQRVKTWHKLERAPLLTFRQKYGEVPLCNTVGRNFVEGAEFDLFSRKRVTDILDNLAEHGLSPGHEITN